MNTAVRTRKHPNPESRKSPRILNAEDMRPPYSANGIPGFLAVKKMVQMLIRWLLLVTSEDAKVIGIIGGLLISSGALLLNLYATNRSIRHLRVSNYQEIIKSHREIWKLTLDSEKYARILSVDVNLLDEPIRYEERRFTQLIFLHMSSAHAFAMSDQMLEIEKLELDFEDFLSLPIPRCVWNQYRSFQNSQFIRFVDGANKPKGIKRLYAGFKGPRVNYAKQWNVLMLGPLCASIKDRVLMLGDTVHPITSQNEIINKEFIRENRIDYVICFGYGKVLDKGIRQEVPCINIHGGLLPYNRGANPNLWAWMDGTPQGVSIHFIDDGIDTGDIIKQKEITFESNTTLQLSAERILKESIAAFKETWPLIRSGQVTAIKQRGAGTYHGFSDQASLEELLQSDEVNLPIDGFCITAKKVMQDFELESDCNGSNQLEQSSTIIDLVRDKIK